VFLEEVHHAALAKLHDTLHKEAERYSTVLQNQPFIDYLYDDKMIMDIEPIDALDGICYQSRLKLKNSDSIYSSISIALDTEAYFPLIYEIDHAWNLRNQYSFLWDSVDKLMEKMTYSTKWTVCYNSPSFSFICESMDNLYDFIKENEDEDRDEVETAKQHIDLLLNPKESNY
jgi:uncharacterized membrane protein YkgB